MSAGDPLRFTVDRGGQQVDLTATPERRIEDDELAGRVRIARIGLEMAPLAQDFIRFRLNPVEAAGAGCEGPGDTVGDDRHLYRPHLHRQGIRRSAERSARNRQGGRRRHPAGGAGTPDPGYMAANLALTLLQLRRHSFDRNWHC